MDWPIACVKLAGSVFGPAAMAAQASSRASMGHRKLYARGWRSDGRLLGPTTPCTALEVSERHGLRWRQGRWAAAGKGSPLPTSLATDPQAN